MQQILKLKSCERVPRVMWLLRFPNFDSSVFFADSKEIIAAKTDCLFYYR